MNHLQIDGTSRITYKGKELSQMNSISTFSDYTVTSEYNVAKVNPAANTNILCLAGCCIPTGYGAVINDAQVTPGSSCAVWGLGGVGMCVIMACRDSGASKIIGVDINPSKFDLVNPKDVNVPEKLAEMTDGGPDFCFVSVGSIPAMEQAFISCHPFWGKTVIIGLSETGATMKAGVWELILGRTLLGTNYGGCRPRIEIPGLVDKVLSGQIQLEKLISHRLPLEKINEGFNMLRSGESIRSIIDFDLKA
ncbi:alcohol dehydrogenase class-3 [Caerostris extrusa]|uniref:Alcohol dehydrogenase class-3 n=1 Tax=Caerostris extrusa TaxID=172846 RepID=A0AAV4PJ87_CAEEX|nr:alcohol dehydrogenase class-3 [Caerostris extrusa]